MELAIKSNEIFPSDDIRPLSDAEIDHVDGGGLPAFLAAPGAAAGLLIPLTCFAVGLAVGVAIANM